MGLLPSVPEVVPLPIPILLYIYFFYKRSVVLVVVRAGWERMLFGEKGVALVVGNTACPQYGSTVRGKV